MMKLIMVSGQPGAGKTSVAKSLLSKIKKSAHIEADSLVMVNPFEYNDKLISLAMNNAMGLISNFLHDGYESIIISGLVKNQKELDDFVLKLDKKIDILFVWLRADQATRKTRKENRKRDESDQEYNFDFVDTLIPDVTSLNVALGKYINIDASNKTIDEVAEEITLNNF